MELTRGADDLGWVVTELMDFESVIGRDSEDWGNISYKQLLWQAWLFQEKVQKRTRLVRGQGASLRENLISEALSYFKMLRTAGQGVQTVFLCK